MLILSTYKLVPFPYDKPVTMLANLYKHFVYLLLYFFAFFYSYYSSIAPYMFGDIWSLPSKAYYY